MYFISYLFLVWCQVLFSLAALPADHGPKVATSAGQSYEHTWGGDAEVAQQIVDSIPPAQRTLSSLYFRMLRSNSNMGSLTMPLDRRHFEAVRFHTFGDDGPATALPAKLAGWGVLMESLESIAAAIHNFAPSIIVDLGAGCGRVSLGLHAIGAVPHSTRTVAAEYTSGGRRCIHTFLRGLPADKRPDVNVIPFDYYSQLAPLRRAVQGHERIFVVSCHSIEQIPLLPPTFFRELLSLAPRVRGFHVEPIGWQLRADDEFSALATRRGWGVTARLEVPPIRPGTGGVDMWRDEFEPPSAVPPRATPRSTVKRADDGRYNSNFWQLLRRLEGDKMLQITMARPNCRNFGRLGTTSSWVGWDSSDSSQVSTGAALTALARDGYRCKMQLMVGGLQGRGKEEVAQHVEWWRGDEVRAASGVLAKILGLSSYGDADVSQVVALMKSNESLCVPASTVSRLDG